MSDLKKRLQREMFLVKPWSILINPFFIIRRGIYRGIEKHAPSMSGKILDVGCGSKPYEELFTSANSYVGIDLEQTGHDHENSKVDVYYDGSTIPFPDSNFDGVVCFEVFEHIFNLEEVLSEIRRVTKQNGKLLVTLPFAWDEHEQPYDFARYTSFGIRHILEKAGFHVESVFKTTTYVEALAQLTIAYISQHIGPKNLALAAVFQLLIVFPLTVLALFTKTFLPKRNELFCNLVVVATRK
jgi:SAM-dependent methyltransferase